MTELKTQKGAALYPPFSKADLDKTFTQYYYLILVFHWPITPRDRAGAITWKPTTKQLNNKGEFVL